MDFPKWEQTSGESQPSDDDTKMILSVSADKTCYATIFSKSSEFLSILLSC